MVLVEIHIITVIKHHDENQHLDNGQFYMHLIWITVTFQALKSTWIENIYWLWV